ncbi:MAG TPA: radical SAM protein [bacterium]|nr:radical SAM protein [bacterium]
MAKVIFIQEDFRERFGIMSLSAVLKDNGHKCDVLINNFDNNIIEKTIEYNPDIIAISAMTPEMNFVSSYVKKIKQIKDIYIILGGAHSTFYPDVINELPINAICLGEGEAAIVELANSFDKKEENYNINNLWFKVNNRIIKNQIASLKDINEYPVPDREIYFSKYEILRNARTKRFLFSRGCPFNCSYCFNYALKQMYKNKNYIRFRTIDNMINEIKYILNNYGMEWVQFNDGTFNLDKKRLLEFLIRYKKEINIPFICNLRIDLVDEEIVEALAECKCDRVDFGIEHGDEEFREKILLRKMSNEHIIKYAKLLKRKNIRIHTANVIGFPGETVEQAFKTIEINALIKPNFANSDLLQPYPGTQIFEYAKKNNFLDKNFSISQLKASNSWDNYLQNYSTSVIKQQNINQLVNLYAFFNLLVQYYWLKPIIKILIKLPPNRFFEIIRLLPEIKRRIKYSTNYKEKLLILKRLIVFFIPKSIINKYLK